MTSRTLRNERFGMLMACGSPGSALAYHLGQSASEVNLLQRTSPPGTPSEGSRRAPAQISPSPAVATASAWHGLSLFALIGHLFDRLDEWSWQRDKREEEAYLSHAQNLYDLEGRMRHLENDGFSRFSHTPHLGGL